jgi:LmbE family N-acetylglucosaminyl deacetylase
MKKVLISLSLLLVAVVLFAQDSPLNVIVIGAHPDDPDGDFGGTAILLSEMGHHVKFLSLTNGDAGHQSRGGGDLARVRIAEAQEAGKRFGVEYDVLDNHDGELMPTLENRLKVIRKIREWDADVVFTHRPNDYHPDHRYTSILVQDAAYMVIVPNVAPEVAPLKKNPIFLYVQDYFQKPNPFEPHIAVDISKVYEQKIYGMAAHASQFFEWLPWTSQSLDKVPETEKERLEWLGARRYNVPTPEIRKCLEQWYGNKASEITHAEAFEICEYGRRPDKEEILRLFPMLPRERD